MIKFLVRMKYSRSTDALVYDLRTTRCGTKIVQATDLNTDADMASWSRFVDQTAIKDGRASNNHAPPIMSSTQRSTQDPVFFDQIRHGLLPLVAPPAGKGHQDEPEPSGLHDRGSLHDRHQPTTETNRRLRGGTLRPDFRHSAPAVKSVVDLRYASPHLLTHRLSVSGLSIPRQYHAFCRVGWQETGTGLAGLPAAPVSV
jgi:hypothetical protein